MSEIAAEATPLLTRLRALARDQRELVVRRALVSYMPGSAKRRPSPAATGTQNLIQSLPGHRGGEGRSHSIKEVL